MCTKVNAAWSMLLLSVAERSVKYLNAISTFVRLDM